MLTNEEKILILLNRLSFNKQTLEEISNIISSKINWFEVFKLSLYHKNATLCWTNLRKFFPSVVIPKYLNDMLECMYNGIKQRNIHYNSEIENIIFETRKNNITILPVKGAMLISNLYKDFGCRYSGDADFLVRYKDIESLEDLLSTQLGYIKGDYVSSERSIRPVSRFEEIKWRVYMSNLYPYCKVVKEEGVPLNYIKLDFRFALDDTLCYDAVDEIIDFYEKEGYAKPVHLLIHLCTHFYNEAKYVISLEKYKDLNLIKLCDIREYINLKIDRIEIDKLVYFARKYNLERAVYYTFYWLRLVYEDGYEKEVLDNLKVDNLEFLTTFGNNTITNQKKFRRSELERLFSCDNVDELKEK